VKAGGQQKKEKAAPRPKADEKQVKTFKTKAAAHFGLCVKSSPKT